MKQHCLERSLLTYELLSRAHIYDTDDQDNEFDTPVVKQAVVNTVFGLQSGSRRPGNRSDIKLKKLFSPIL